MSPSKLVPTFDFSGLVIKVDCLLPTRALGAKLKESAKFRSLVASIREVGVVEPVSVYPQSGGRYLILDGHARVEALREMGALEVPCLVATQDESYTYNKKVNYIAPIQANRMILKALDAGVPEERIASALNLAVKTVRHNRLLLQGICPEAVELLRDKHVAQETLALLKRVKPLRQMEMAEVMVASGTYSAPYARALVMTTPTEQLVDPSKRKKVPGVKPEDLVRLENEVRLQEKDFRMLDETYNEHVMALTIARGYLRPLLENNRIVRFLAQHYREFLVEFQRIVETNALEG